MFGSMTDSLATWGQIIDAVGGTGAVADGLGCATSTVSSWRSRPRGIPSDKWAAFVELAAGCGRPDINEKTLAGVAARRGTEFAETRA
jgi:hypothetical protein